MQYLEGRTVPLILYICTTKPPSTPPSPSPPPQQTTLKKRLVKNSILGELAHQLFTPNTLVGSWECSVLRVEGVQLKQILHAS